jgi:hypothetical protein
MDRLRGQRVSEDADVAFAARLLDATEPRQPSPEACARVLAEVKRQRRRQPRMVLRPAAVIVALLLFIVAPASAMWGRAIVTRATSWARGRLRSTRAADHAPTPAPGVPALSTPVDEPTIARDEAPAEAPAAVKHTVRGNARPALPEPAKSSTPSTPPMSDESVMVAEAFRALRQDGDRARAAALLDGYLAEHADGELLEEALGLRMEAAQRAGDDAGAFARRYVARFPRGKLHVLAERLARD